MQAVVVVLRRGGRQMALNFSCLTSPNAPRLLPPLLAFPAEESWIYYRRSRGSPLRPAFCGIFNRRRSKTASRLSGESVTETWTSM
ncbi:hypothetical protein AOLI_G00281130 [Acnodon oligacanthus]